MFKEKVVIVTGGASGIGRDIVQSFRNNGAKVAIIDILDKIDDCDLYYEGDIANKNNLELFVKEVVNKFGNVDYIINNACISKGGLLNDCSYEDFLYVQQIGVVAPYYLTKLLLPYLNKNSAIVNISSTRYNQSEKSWESYSAAKGGITSLTHSLAISLSNVARVNAISPGWIDVSGEEFSELDNLQHPAGRIGKASDISELAMFLCSEKASFINGENIVVDGGMSKLMIYNEEDGSSGSWKFNK